MRDKSELDIAKKLGGKVTNASGAVNDDGDIKIPGFLIESKRRDTIKNVVFYPRVWEKLRKQAVKTNRLPMYMFTNKGNTYCITYRDVLKHDIMRDKEIIETRTSGRFRSNLNIDPEEYRNVHDLAYVTKKYPLLTFYYGKFAFGIVDLDTLKNCLNGRSNG